LFRRLLLLALLVSLSACAQFQRFRQSLATSAQPAAGVKVLRAPADWGELTHDAAYRLLQRASQVEALRTHPIFVTEPKQATPFALALHTFVLSNLTEMGLTVAEKQTSASYLLEVDVQSVKLSAGMQVVVTTAIGNGDHYLFRSSDVYAVNQSDVNLYDASMLPQVLPPTQTKTMTVTGK